MQTVGARVRMARKAAGLSRKRLSEMAEMSERYLIQIEHGDANISIHVLARVASALSADVVALFPTSHGTPGDHPPPAALRRPLADLLRTMSLREQQGAVDLLQRYLRDSRRSLKGVALLGLRGAGKSTIGKLLSERHGLPFISITGEIETRAGMSLDDLFDLGGSEAYRTLENEFVRELNNRNDCIVLETAGGIVANSPALDAIFGSFMTVWLKASPEEHLDRVVRQGDMRPMHGNSRALSHLKSLLAQREQEYARADCVIDTTGRTPEACLRELELLAAGAVGPIIPRALGPGS
jgi:XRE family transcriptional regulator, aerobic/anaerobic benzoate catabolism transcriptional regulator